MHTRLGKNDSWNANNIVFFELLGSKDAERLQRLHSILTLCDGGQMDLLFYSLLTIFLVSFRYANVRSGVFI